MKVQGMSGVGGLRARRQPPQMPGCLPPAQRHPPPRLPPRLRDGAGALKYAVASKMSIHSRAHGQEEQRQLTGPLGQRGKAATATTAAAVAAAKPTTRGHGRDEAAQRVHVRHEHAGREYEDPEIKDYLKAHAARALGTLATGNPAICKNITESRALLCFSILLEKATGDVQYNSAMALVEICRVAEQNAELRRSAFAHLPRRAPWWTSSSASWKADYDDLLIPCITCLGCLSRTFRATETRVIGPLVRLLDEREADVSLEAAAALAKFACMDNYLHVDHCKSIIAHGGAKHLVQLVYFGEQVVQTAALVLVCYLAHNVPDSEDLAQAEILTVLDWAWKQGYMSQDPVIESLLPEAKIRMELYQSRVGYY
ncbi:unnamed protein product [Miscanthus lutarioriparius]|uniref:Uncharacterized protein n=1 Tax=Miscanthus lutarioriparius TaxID=422564 RepID=A0A811PR87_9POAL|nr:unnamed protein product [Miscanthus lutarioriparius]